MWLRQINNFALFIFVLSVVFETWNPFNLGGIFSIARMSGLLYAATSLPFIKQRINPQKFKSVFFAILVFFVFYTFSSLANLQEYIGIRSIVSMAILQNIIMLVLVANHIIYHPKLINKILWVLWGSIAFMGVLYYLGIGYELDRELGRVSLFGENPNGFGFKAAIGGIIALFFLLENRPGNKVFLSAIILSLPLFFSMILASGSRGAFFILLGAGFAHLYFLKAKPFLKVFLYGAGVVLGFFIWGYALTEESALQERLFLTVETGHTSSRDILMANAIQGFLKYPVWGVGRVPLQTTQEFREPHNVYIAVLLASGLFGFIPFLIFNWKILRMSYSLFKVSKKTISLILMLAINLNMMKAGGWVNSKLLWFSYAFIIGGFFALKHLSPRSYFQRSLNDSPE